MVPTKEQLFLFSFIERGGNPPEEGQDYSKFTKEDPDSSSENKMRKLMSQLGSKRQAFNRSIVVRTTVNPAIAGPSTCTATSSDFIKEDIP